MPNLQTKNVFYLLKKINLLPLITLPILLFYLYLYLFLYFFVFILTTLLFLV